VTEASRSAQQAATIIEQVLSDAMKLAQGALEHELADAAAAATEALSFLDSSFATLGTLFRDKPDKVTPDVQSQRDALDKRVTALRRRIEAAQKTKNAGGLRDAARLSVDIRSELDKLAAAFGPLSLRSRGVQAALEDGARQFFAGDYQQALATLDSASLNDAPLQLHVHLFRAAAAYHLFVRSGEKDQALRTRALAEVEACKKLNSQFTPDSRAFAPRFLTFYENATPAAP
jgi:chaperonin cofactor prefoldin